MTDGEVLDTKVVDYNYNRAGLRTARRSTVMNSATKFEIGDIVRLRAGGPVMSVCDVVLPHSSENTVILLSVFWIDSGGGSNAADLPAVCFVMESPLRK